MIVIRGITKVAKMSQLCHSTFFVCNLSDSVFHGTLDLTAE
ncbi:predicted protein [Botrytis cinerea T4]|uniref:Uncharacterized protein n=1 Tax=Botryotinia fuckeliana (strain T4) TaxID=999810 RepID=G2YYE6_BOTF4|nr:predicted protein [Botrytis cinerea T4]